MLRRPRFDIPLARDRLAQLTIPLDAAADELSGGQQAQVGLALALGTRAPVLLLDEPLASLDPLARREFLHVLVDAVREARATAILSSHVIADIAEACDRLLVLGGGRKLLDADLDTAVGGHRVGPTAGGDARRVREFLGPDGGRLVLWAVTPDAPWQRGLRPATLEEVVLGHLAASRVA